MAFLLAAVDWGIRRISAAKFEGFVRAASGPSGTCQVTVHGPMQRITLRRRGLGSTGSVTALFLSRT